MCKLVKATDFPASKVMEFRQAFLSAGECSIPGSRGLHNYDKYEEWLWLVKECEKPDNTLLGVQASTYLAVRNDDTVVGCIELRHTLNEALTVIGGHIGFSTVPAERRKGYATEMLRQVLQVAKQAGLQEVHLSVERNNEPSVKTIVKNGGTYERSFEFEGEEADIYRIVL
jgi:predicted acetyltransferase